MTGQHFKLRNGNKFKLDEIKKSYKTQHCVYTKILKYISAIILRKRNKRSKK